MRRRTLLAALGMGSTGLAGCSSGPEPTQSPTGSSESTASPRSGPVETEFTFENLHDATWVLEATFVDLPFAGVDVTMLDGSNRALDDATTTWDVFDGVDRPERVTSVSFRDASTVTLDRTVPSGETVGETVETWTGAGLVALLHREDAADDPDFRAFMNTGCVDDAPLMESVRLSVDADGSRSLQGQCGRE